AEAGRRADLVRPAHGREDERITRRRHGGEMLTLAQDDRADTDAAAFLERIAQERVWLYRPRTRGRQIVRVIEVEVVDRVGGDEVADLEGLRGLHARLLEIFVGHHH